MPAQLPIPIQLFAIDQSERVSCPASERAVSQPMLCLIFSQAFGTNGFLLYSRKLDDGLTTPGPANPLGDVLHGVLTTYCVGGRIVRRPSSWSVRPACQYQPKLAPGEHAGVEIAECLVTRFRRKECLLSMIGNQRRC
jgi:hypothetical protein